MKLFKTTLTVFCLCATLAIVGCGDEPGAHMDDPTPPGEATPEISDDPDEVANQMGDDYAQEQAQ